MARLAGVCAFLIAFSPTTGSGCHYDGTAVARVFITGAGASELFPPFPSPVTGTISYDFWASFGSLQEVPLVLRSVHFVAAAIMFLVLGYFSFFVFTLINSSTSLDAAHASARKRRRNRWYRVLGVAIFAAVLAIGVKPAVVEWLLSEPNGARFWSSPGLMDTFSLMKESVFHAENEEPVPDGIQGPIGCTGANWAQCCEPCKGI